ncbi:MAG: hypothetical protein H6813_05480 [Phycisphaeraceae bacterium]|nr:hypothetical protein [Phycisphaeraceae bacterium]MCB9847919.1 hypothetical protein [Phycisphaeraceae bacterium]
MNIKTWNRIPVRLGLRFGALALGAGSALTLATAPAAAQVSAVDQPYVVVVDADTAALRCGADELYYEVGEVKRGAMLLVDGSDATGIDGDGWLRVAFPADQPALIKALPEQLDVDAMRGTLTLLRPSRLIAMSMDGDLSQSWKKLLNKPLEPGATLKIQEIIRDANGQPLAYVVPAPDTARGYIHGRYVRQATASEAMAFRAGQREAQPTTQLATAPAQTPPAPLAQQHTITPKPEPAPEQAMARPGSTVAESPDSEALPEYPEHQADEQPMTPADTTLAQNDQGGSDVGSLLGMNEQAPGKAADQPEQTTAQAPAPAMDQTHAAPPVFPPSVYHDRKQPTNRVAAAGEDEGADTRAASKPKPKPEPEAEQPTIENRPLPTMRDLESAYAAVLAQKSAMAELEPLIGEHVRYLAAMDKGDAPGDDLDREVLVAHMELLKIRADLQQSMLRIEDAREQAQKNIERIDHDIAGIDRSSEYIVVGRLTTSVVYDGKRLPLLYRVQSVDENSGRTLAYVVPVNGVDCAGSLGSIVGVAGTSRIDASSRLNIVTPTRIDSLRVGATASADENGRSN